MGAAHRGEPAGGDALGEAEVGEGIRMAIAEGLVTRDDLWITSKLWNTYHAREHVEPACRRSLSDLGLDYVDIFYSHRFDPDTPLEETMMALDRAVRSGKALYAGISSYNARRTREAAVTGAERTSSYRMARSPK